MQFDKRINVLIFISFFQGDLSGMIYLVAVDEYDVYTSQEVNIKVKVV